MFRNLQFRWLLCWVVLAIAGCGSERGGDGVRSTESGAVTGDPPPAATPVDVASANADNKQQPDQPQPVQLEEHVQLALNWYAEAEHGGYIAAQSHGFYPAQGLTVEIIPGGPGAPQQVIAELAAERISFAISDADNVVSYTLSFSEKVSGMRSSKSTPVTSRRC